MKNYINIDQQDYGKKIFRILSIDRLIEMFEKKKNVLVKPDLWDDPFENFILNIPVKDKTGKGSKSILRKRGYGQCWTLNVESDAMWRIYSPDKNGVKIQTTIRKLFRSLCSAQKSYASISCYIGKVKYYPKKDIEKLISDRIAGRKQFNGSIGQARSLLFKRLAFKHENEIRLIFLDPHNKSNSNVYLYPCEPLAVIDRITFDPRMNQRLYKIFKKYLKGIGFQGTLVQSNLYRPPKFT
ncbi:MAG: hypothetical protein SRB2_04543 [Desulfobacteraceae bacterium Eth-SRB2]|nr:MAG: hypothetical protein SRB2_04543 [Desulfobacteraceae bacterium Eth-SRB2]